MKTIEQNFAESPNKCWNKMVVEAGAIPLKKECRQACAGYGAFLEYSEVMFCKNYTRIKTLEFIAKDKGDGSQRV
jgi:hypothetical protein